jgi:hypothetical protein
MKRLSTLAVAIFCLVLGGQAIAQQPVAAVTNVPSTFRPNALAGTKCVLEYGFAGWGPSAPWRTQCHPLGSPEADEALSYYRASGIAPHYAINQDCFTPGRPFGVLVPILGKKDSITPCFSVMGTDGQMYLYRQAQYGPKHQ